MRFHAGQQLFALKRFGDIVDTSGLKTFDLVRHILQPTDEDHRNVTRLGVLFKTPANLKPVHIRQPNVEQNQFWRIFSG